MDREPAAGPARRIRRDGDLTRNPARAAAVGFSMLALVALIAVVIAIDVTAPPLAHDLDVAWRRTATGWPSTARRIGELFERAGAGVVMVPLRIGVAAFLALRRRRWDLAAWLAGWLLADVFTAVLKPALARERPTPTDPGNPFTSFPSAHAKTAGQVAIGLVLLGTTPWRSRLGWYALATVWIVLMAWSRTAIDHHWLSDVIAGSLVGVGSACATAAIVQRARDARDTGHRSAPR